jgi:galactose mutarotase-like enzyme
MITEEFRKAWPYEFGLVYSVTLSPDNLETSLQVQNKGSESFDFHVLLHNYFKVPVSCTSRLHGELALTRRVLGRLQNRRHKPPRQSIHRQSRQ